MSLMRSPPLADLSGKGVSSRFALASRFFARIRLQADLKREFETWVPGCTACGMDVHRVSGVNVADGDVIAFLQSEAA